MNCHYCNQICRCNVSSWICESCRVEYFDGHINYSTDINGTKYTLQLRYEHTEFPARIIGGTGKNVVALKLTSLPQNITPTNVNEKIRLYLLFS
jgi:hypothetical protein